MRFLVGIPQKFDIPKKCKSVLQIVIFDFDENGHCVDAFKIKRFCDNQEFIAKAFKL